MLNKLRIEVMEILENMAEMNESTIKEEIEDILNCGCQSGIVGDLMYYYQTEAFFNRHKDAINKMAHELSNDIYGSPYEIYKNLNGECDKNTMAWFGFEEMCNIILTELED